MIAKDKILPSVLIIFDIAVAIGYIPGGEWRRVIYWFAAAALTYVVTR